jgi:hypothetical protein
MKIKWNWGTGITIFIILFVSFILWRVYKTTQHPVMLVEKDYYPKGLQYQQRIDERHNARLYKPKFLVYRQSEEVVIHFPVLHPDTSRFTFFRPSDNRFDLSFPFRPDSLGLMHFPLQKFKKGKYILKIYWEEKGKKFYVEKSFNLQ